MQSAQTSRAASGAEHQFSHLWDMQHHTHNGQAPSHGFKVGIATLAVTALYECLLSYPVENLDPSKCCEAWPNDSSRDELIGELFPENDLRAVALQETQAKALSADALRLQLKAFCNAWPDIRPRLQEQLLPFNQVKVLAVRNADNNKNGEVIHLSMAGVQGFEPQLADPESAVLPLNDTPMS